MGQKRFGHVDGVAVLPGQAQISWLEGRNDKYTRNDTVHRIRIFWTTILINKQP